MQLQKYVIMHDVKYYMYDKYNTRSRFQISTETTTEPTNQDRRVNDIEEFRCICGCRRGSIELAIRVCWSGS